MNYSHIINDSSWVWSYSRIRAFEDCPYRFYLKYIKKTNEVRGFFSDYGSFMHRIIQRFLTGEQNREDLASYYLANFRENVVGKAPSSVVFRNYFRQGLEYLKNIQKPSGEIIGVEKEVSFDLDGKKFIGYIDMVSRADGIRITDHKSRSLKPRSKRTKGTKRDAELDKYLRQLYLYSIPIEKEYGEYPKFLCLNCFRSQSEIVEPFDKTAYHLTKKWALDEIETILREEKWAPKIDSFRCGCLCEMRNSCEYYQMFGGAV